VAVTDYEGLGTPGDHTYMVAQWERAHGAGRLTGESTEFTAPALLRQRPPTTPTPRGASELRGSGADHATARLSGRAKWAASARPS
jgi:hypothetical protein